MITIRFSWTGRAAWSSVDGDLKRALVDEVLRRAAGRRPSAEMPAIDVTAFTRAKVESMVRGLFPRSE